MARMSNHRVTEIWQNKKDSQVTYHVDDNNRLLRLVRNKRASAKLLFFDEHLKEIIPGHNGFNFSGMGRRADVAEYRAILERRAVKL